MVCQQQTSLLPNPPGRPAKRSLAMAAAAVGRNFTGGDNYHLVEYREALKQSGERARAYTELEQLQQQQQQRLLTVLLLYSVCNRKLNRRCREPS